MKNINFFISLVGIYYENSNFAYNNIDHKKIPPLFLISEYSEFFLLNKYFPRYIFSISLLLRISKAKPAKSLL